MNVSQITWKNTFHVTKCIIYLCLCLTTVLFTKEVIKKFNSKSTSFIHYEQPITEYPTVVICFGDKFINYDADDSYPFGGKQLDFVIYCS